MKSILTMMVETVEIDSSWRINRRAGRYPAGTIIKIKGPSNTWKNSYSTYSHGSWSEEFLLENATRVE